MATHIDEQTMQELERRLQQRRAELVRELTGPDARAPDDVSEGRDPEDEVDLASTQVLRDPQDAILERHRDELALIDRALRRIADGTYGTDEQGGNIPLERLRAIPWATS